MSTDQQLLATQRRAARRTAWLFAAIALAIYAGFMLSGVSR
jgi:hypothetical protein